MLSYSTDGSCGCDIRMLVEQILSGHQNARKAKQRVKEIKQKIGKW